MVGQAVSPADGYAEQKMGRPNGLIGANLRPEQPRQNGWRSGQGTGPTIANHPPTRQELVSRGTVPRTRGSLLDGRAVRTSYGSGGPKALRPFANTARRIGGHKRVSHY